MDSQSPSLVANKAGKDGLIDRTQQVAARSDTAILTQVPRTLAGTAIAAFVRLTAASEGGQFFQTSMDVDLDECH
jgi:hypothetical protein